MISKKCLRWHHLTNAYNCISTARTLLSSEPDLKPVNDDLERPLNALWDVLEAMRDAED